MWTPRWRQVCFQGESSLALTWLIYPGPVWLWDGIKCCRACQHLLIRWNIMTPSLKSCMRWFAAMPCCAHTSMDTQTQTHTHTQTHTYTHAHTYKHMYTHTLTCMPTHTHTQVCRQAKQTNAHTHTHICMHYTCMQTHTNNQTSTREYSSNNHTWPLPCTQGPSRGWLMSVTCHQGYTEHRYWRLG